MNIKDLDQYKDGFLEFLDILPISQMEEDIKNNNDNLIKNMYAKLQYCIKETNDSRYKKIYHDLGICSIYSLLDPCYGDIMRFMLDGIRKSDFDLHVKPPRLWRVNNTHKTGRK